MTITAINVVAAMALLDRGTAQAHTTRTIGQRLECQPHEMDRAMRDAIEWGWVSKTAAMHQITPAGRARIMQGMASKKVRARAKDMPGAAVRITAPDSLTGCYAGQVTRDIDDGDPAARAMRWAIMHALAEVDEIMAVDLDAMLRRPGQEAGNATRSPSRTLERMGLVQIETRRVKIGQRHNLRIFLSLTAEGRKRIEEKRREAA